MRLIIAIPASEWGTIKATHLQVLGGLLKWADAEGKCWPSLRTLAEACGMTLSRVQRAIEEMVALGYLKIRRRLHRSNFYQIAARFLTRAMKPADRETRPAKARGGSPASGTPVSHRENRPGARHCGSYQASFAQGASPASETKGESKKGVHEDSIAKGDSGRYAPSAEDKAHVAACVGEITAVLTGRAPKATDEPTDPVAYAAAVKQNRRQAWLRKLHTWAGIRLFGRTGEWLAACAVLHEAEQSVKLPRDVQRRLDELNARMRDNPLRPGEAEGLA